MTEMPPYVAQNPNFEPCKPKKQCNLYSSLLFILLSIFTYILIFYILDVSPSSIFNDAKILFFISNALILIIAADYGAFTDKENHYYYEEYITTMRTDARENPSAEHSGYGVNLAEEIKYREKQETAGAKDIPQYLLHKEAEIPEKTIRVVSEDQSPTTAIEKFEAVVKRNNRKTAFKEGTCDARKLMNPRSYGRSKSDKARSERRHQKIKHRSESYGGSKSDSSEWMVVHKEKKAYQKAHEAEEKWENVREESEEFSKMSNEELNRRVEDFIQQFNRDIKRQKSFV